MGPCDSLWRLMPRLTRIGLAVLVTILCSGCSFKRSCASGVPPDDQSRSLHSA